MNIQKSEIIHILETELITRSNSLSPEFYDALSCAIGALKKGSKSRKGYRRFKRKYVVLNHVLTQYLDELLTMNETSKDLTWNDSINLFWKYFKEGEK